ncbi:hypothetical protein Y032_0002g810 [Ancylostoma ceylanicum]|nr:hypothetical protein Y032_0002g810 [Ancylostoma ceylanicum]
MVALTAWKPGTVEAADTNSARLDEPVIVNCFFPNCKKRTLRWKRSRGIRDLKDHARTHWGKPVLNCQHCEAVLLSSNQYYNHYKKHHQGEKHQKPNLLGTEQDREELRAIWEQCFTGKFCYRSEILVTATTSIVPASNSMRGRTFPAVNSVLARSISSYVQVNIYDTSLKKLRARGVDIKHLLQHVGCRSVVMDVPIFSSELKKLGGFAGHRLNRSFGGFSRRVHSSPLGKSRRYSESVDARETMCDAQHVSLESVREEGSIEESAVEEFADCRTDFSTTVVRGASIGPLTSTPLPPKNGNSLVSFANPNVITEDYRVTAGTVERTSFRTPEKMNEPTSASDMNIRRPFFDLEASAIAKDEPPVEYDVEQSVTPSVESSFAVFQSAVVQGLNTINESKAQPLNSAMNCDGAQQQDAEVHLSNYEDDGYCHSEYLCDTNPEIDPRYEVSEVQNNLVGAELVANERATSSPNLINSDVVITKCSPISTTSENAIDDSHLNPAITQLDPLVRSAPENPENIAMEIQSDTTQNKVATPLKQAKSSRKKRKRTRAPASKDLEDSEHEETEPRIGGVEEVAVKRTAKSKSASKEEDDAGKRVFHCQIPLCQKTLSWRPRYGKNRLVDHVRTHWGRAVKQCKLCDYKAPNFRQVHHHHTQMHPNQPYLGALSIETKEDLEELLDLWKQCFPSL